MIKCQSPDQQYPELFHAVQVSRVFDDSKTFADAIPLAEPAALEAAYLQSRTGKDFDLGVFVARNFKLPRDREDGAAGSSDESVRGYIGRMWSVLTREADERAAGGSLIPLPRPYVVPGGRFREIYYWDSYFTMLGLAAQEEEALVENMVANFAFLIDEIGFVPNGNRTYFRSRSQPPFFSLMVELLAELKRDEGVYLEYLPQLEKEYAFWMDGSGDLDADTRAARRVVSVDGGILNRYWDDLDTPRPESYAEDLSLAGTSGRPAGELYRDLRAACESGWDFSSRWLGESGTLESIRTTSIVPVDLNCLLYKLESVLETASRVAGNSRREQIFADLANQRKLLIQELFFDDSPGIFGDLLLPNCRGTGVHSLATMFPLFFGLATPDQARKVADSLRALFLRPGGWVTSAVNSGQQWDEPNGWPPLQWISYVGLRNYGFSGPASEGARRWVGTNLRIFRETGKLLEKYDVEDISKIAGGGEYTVQDGFGWTNAVLLRLLDALEIP